MRKGDLVEFKKNLNGRTQRYDSNTYYGERPITQEEQTEWYNSEASKGMTSAGETKLPPRSVVVKLQKSTCYLVEKARCRVYLNYGNPQSGMTKIKCLKTGKIAFVHRADLQVIT
tara:strand:+ start:514 stop:858 length:345 start_codon:yes stop_codon:yes gene_type:complete